MLKKIIVVLLVIFILIQFIQIDVSIPANAQTRTDFLEKYSPPEEITSMIKDGCYDCHSYNTEYPWYSNIAPISWLTKDHVKEGREHLNFSDWDSYDLKKKKHKLEECHEEIEGLKMPEEGYVMMHDEADFTAEQREKLITYFKKLEESITN